MSFEIVDAHHHIWRKDKTPWLNGPVVPRIFGDYEPIKRDYGIREFAADAKPSGVAKSVYIQINVAPGDEVWEVEWAAAEGRRHDLVNAIVSFADLADPGVGDILDRQMASGPIRGVRQQLHWHTNPAFRFQPTPDLMLDPRWARGLRAVAARGLHFELQVFPRQYASSLKLVDRHPEATFILLHAGMPDDLSEDGLRVWIKGLEEFARRPNVLAKISGLGTFSRSCDAREWKPIIERTVDTFGPDRCLFGSNFPIEKLWTDYTILIEAIRGGLSGYHPVERQAVLRDTAIRVYKLGDACP
jgi:predicted TIM-barrel fold metal-dependent hydrolase